MRYSPGSVWGNSELNDSPLRPFENAMYSRVDEAPTFNKIRTAASELLVFCDEIQSANLHVVAPIVESDAADKRGAFRALEVF
jgi:hypothetical protein